MSKIIRIVTHAPHLDIPPVMPEGGVYQSVPPLTKFVRLLRAVREWNRQGRPITPKPILILRTAACESCELYNKDGNWGLGECRAPGCNCTRVKRWLANEKCPHPNGPRWPQ